MSDVDHAVGPARWPAVLLSTTAAWGAMPLAVRGGRSTGVALVLASAGFALSTIFAIDKRPRAQRVIACVGVVGAGVTGAAFVAPFILQS